MVTHCTLLVGMQRLPEEELRFSRGVAQSDEGLDNQTVARIRRRRAQERLCGLRCCDNRYDVPKT
jgi:hypothetical protein